MPKVGIIAPHPDFGKMAEDLAEELGINLMLKEFNQANLTGLLKSWENGLS